MGTKTQATDVGLDAFEQAWAEFFASVRRSKGRAATEEGDLTFSQHYLLAALADQPGMPTGELALPAGVSPPTATRMRDGLERDGIVTREPSAEDRRKVTISLTEEGRRIVRRKQREVSARRRAVYESLSESEREQAVHLMHRLAGLIEGL
ncbi:MAG: MarR family winged helix-turn-helix transcriptional regulator [Solirubrobacterales bacterium]